MVALSGISADSIDGAYACVLAFVQEASTTSTALYFGNNGLVYLSTSRPSRERAGWPSTASVLIGTLEATSIRMQQGP